jgi:hypothetical protein
VGSRRVLGRFFAVVLCLAASASASVRVRRGEEIDLVLLGYAVFQTNLSEDIGKFFDAGDGFPSEFTNRQVLNLRLDGQMGKGVALDAKLLHDRENLRDWRYLVRLTGKRNLFGLGELDGAFRDTQFTAYDTPYYGVEGRLGLGKLTTSAFATSRDNNYRVDRLRGNNLSGPFILSASPVFEGSERVAIEVYDRRDQQNLLSSDLQVRGEDYTVDYATGTLLFRAPIASETFDGNPIQVMVEYQYEPRTGSAGETLGGARLQFEPAKGVRLGSTYLRSGGDGATAISRDGVLGLDQHITLGDWLQADNEMAGPPGELLDRREGAWRLGVGVKPCSSLELRGGYRRVGKDFDTTANPRLDTELDREEWTLDTSFVPVKEHRVVAGYGVKLDNVAEDPAIDRTRIRTIFAGWEGQLRPSSQMGLRLERRITDGAAAALADSRIDTVTYDVTQKLGTLPLLGESMVRGQYRFETSEEALVSRVTHTFKARIDAKPWRDLETFLEWRESRGHGDGATAVESQTREWLAGGLYRMSSKLLAGASVRLRTNLDRGEHESSAERTTAIIDLRYEPSDRFRGVLKYEWNLATSGSDQSDTRNLFASLQVVPFSGMTLAAGYKIDDRGAELETTAEGYYGEYFLSVLYKDRGGSKGGDGDGRFTFFARAEKGLNEERLPPFESTLSERLTWLFGGTFDLTRSWQVLGELKDERLSGATVAHRRALVLELSRSLTRYLRIAGGVELAIDEQGEVDKLNRERVYLKLIGRL